MKAVVALALLVACSGSSAPGVRLGDAGDAEGIRRGRQGASDAVAVDVVVPVVDVAPVVDVVPVVDVAPVVDMRSADAVADWGRVDDAGVLHCRQNPVGAVKCAAYEIATGDRWIRCWLDLSSSIPASCRRGVEGQASYDWYVLACADCASLEDWGAR